MATASGPTYKQTSYTEVASPTRTSAQELWVVENATGAKGASLGDAIAATKTEAGLTRTVNGKSVPYFSATATSPLGSDTTHYVRINYRPLQTEVDLAVAANRQTKAFASTATMEWWSDLDQQDGLGRPNGELRFQPEVLLPGNPGTPRPWSWQFGTVTYMLTTVLANSVWLTGDNFQPIIHLSPKIGRANSNNVSNLVDGFTFPANTLVFRGYRAEPLHDATWLIRYIFVYNPHEWVQELPPAYNQNVIDSPSRSWIKSPLVNLFLRDEMLDSLSFPVHTPTP